MGHSDSSQTHNRLRSNLPSTKQENNRGITLFTRAVLNLFLEDSPQRWRRISPWPYTAAPGRLRKFLAFWVIRKGWVTLGKCGFTTFEPIVEVVVLVNVATYWSDVTQYINFNALKESYFSVSMLMMMMHLSGDVPGGGGGARSALHSVQQRKISVQSCYSRTNSETLYSKCLFKNVSQTTGQ